MSEASSRPSARGGRGSARGGRGGFAGRGGRRTNGDKPDTRSDNAGPSALDDEGDFAELRKQYGSKTSVIREMFPDWSEADVLFALEETNGDENEAVTRIAEGTISQWGEVSKPKKTTRTKTKEPSATPTATESSATGARAPRGGRSVSEGGRGRARASDRGGRATRGRPAAAGANSSRGNASELSVPTEESSAWNNEPVKSQVAEPTQPSSETIAEPKAEPAKPAAPAAKTWASMLRSSAPKPVAKPKETPAQAPALAPTEPIETPTIAELPETTIEPAQAEQDEVTPVVAQADIAEQPKIVEPEVALPPSKDELTETNLEQVIDTSIPPATATAASTAADSWDPRQNPPSSTATPISAAQQQHHVPRPAIPSVAPGFAASALKATTGRLPSYQRRVLDQEEAVRMPGNSQVDHAAVQFGAFNLNDGDDDIDGEREEPETRAQPPADSPIAHPRASLPPAPQPAAVPESFPQKASAPVSAQPSTAAAAPQAPAQSQAPQGPAAGSLGRYPQAGPQETQQKPLDPFSQQVPSSQPPFDNFSSQTSQPQAQQPGGAFSSAPSDYSSYYTSGQQDRNAYNNYYGQQYGQHAAQQDAMGSQRGFAGYGASQTDNLSQYPQSGSHNQGRFGSASNDAQNSGHSTPNPTAQGQQGQQQGSQVPGQPQGSQQPQQQGAPGSQPQAHNQQYPYNHPYYSNPYYHQYYSGYGQAGFNPYGNKNGGMYGQPYGNAPYDQHASSPAGFGQSALHRDSALSSGLGEYGRAGSSQGTSQPGLGGSNNFGSVHDSFGRGASSFQSQGQGYGQGQPAGSASGDDLKPFGDAKTAGGPSPSMGGARPGSAANNASTGQSSLPPPQGSQMGGGYGGYPSHLQGQGQGHGLHGSSGYGMGGQGGSNQHGNSPYGSYSQGFGGSGYYGGGGQPQQRGGWGGNYH